MTAGRLLAATWEWEPSIVIGCALLLGAYLALVRPLRVRDTALFATGVVVLLLALVSPLDGLGDDYLFSAHMLQHLLLILAVPPLLVTGLPAATVERLLALPGVAPLERFLRRAPVAWAPAIVTLWVWHAPSLYDATVESETVHIAEHLMFLVTWTIFWWPLLSRREASRMRPVAGVFYVFAAATANAILGILITWAPAGLYPAYLHVDDELGALSYIRETLGITVGVDQQFGGLFMWVIGSFVFLGFIVALLARWYREPEREDARPERSGGESRGTRDTRTATRAPTEGVT